MRGDALLWIVGAGAANRLGSSSFITAFPMGETGRTVRATSSFVVEPTTSLRRSWSMGGDLWRLGGGAGGGPEQARPDAAGGGGDDVGVGRGDGVGGG
jgi:hypothetical protein